MCGFKDISKLIQRYLQIDLGISLIQLEIYRNRIRDTINPITDMTKSFRDVSKSIDLTLYSNVIQISLIHLDKSMNQIIDISKSN